MSTMIRKFENSQKVKEAAKKALVELKNMSADDLLKLGEENKNGTTAVFLRERSNVDCIK